MSLTWRLLKFEAKLVATAVELVLKGATKLALFGIGLLGGRISRRAAAGQEGAPAAPPQATPAEPSPWHREAHRHPQHHARSRPAAGASAPAPAGVTVTVHNNLMMPTPSTGSAPAAAVPAATAATPAEPENRAPADVLNQPDHTIYITTGSHLMMEHPYAERLLLQLNKMLFVAGTRVGGAYDDPPEPDTSAPLPGAEQITRIVPLDEGFDPCRERPVPAPDGLVWVARAGRDCARAVSTGRH